MKQVFEFDKNMTALTVDAQNIVWRSAKDPAFGLFGSDALNEKGFYRLTEAERDHIRPVSEGEAWLGEHSAGISVLFETDSPQICVRAKIRSPFNMTNETHIGQCGMDLYVYDERFGEYILHEVTRFPFEADSYEVPLGHFQDGKMRKYIMYLPLYIAMDDLEIGLSEGSAVRPGSYGVKTRIGVYGTSITQGCSASRPGMAYTSIVSRALDEEILNFGFSGNAMMEKEMGEVLGKRKLDLLIVDTEANAGCDDKMQNNAHAFMDAFFAGNPSAPVIIYSRIPMAFDAYDDYRIRLNAFYKKFQRDLAREYAAKGHEVIFADGSKILRGNYPEYFTDGIHPTDLGMVAIAKDYIKQIKKIRSM